jgi:predicted nuclease of restriction endonuclease-like RecB superfamily
MPGGFVVTPFMLTGDLVRARLEGWGNRLQIDFLDGGDGHWLRTAGELIALLRSQVGHSQAEWAAAVSAYEGNRTDYMVIRGLAKVLADEATFTATATPAPPAEVRARLFAQGPVFSNEDLLHPRTRDLVLRETAVEYQVSSRQIEETLYADRPAAYILTDAGPAWTADSLIARYNLELARAALYWCDGMTVQIYDNFKDFWRYLKLFKLMFWATPIPGGYSVELDGPISPFVKATTRYGRQFAAFLPALLLGERWSFTASVRLPPERRPLRYQLDHTSALASHFRRSGEFDSRLEADFAAEFQAKFGDERGAWRLTREDEVLLLGDTVMIPDFALTHKKDGRRALIELVGFWHPNYLARKVAKVRAANRRDLILLVYEGVNLAPGALQDVPSEVLPFAHKPVIKEVMAAVERVAA